MTYPRPAPAPPAPRRLLLPAALLALAGLAAPLPALAQTGACCTGAVGDCATLSPAACAAAGGVYRGDGTDCATTVCLRFVQTLRGSGSSAGIGQFIDFTPEEGGQSILIRAIDYHVTTSSAPAGAPVSINVWVHDGTYREAETFDPAKWTMHETLSGTSVGGGATTPVRVNFTNPVLVQRGRTKALFLHTQQGTMHFRTNVERNPTLSSNGEAVLYSERYRFGITGGGGWNGTLTTARDFMGAIYYEPADESVTGPCCLPDGACATLTLAACATQQGLFRPGADCASLTCEQQGACCYPDGTCAAVYQQDCTGRFQGTWNGPASTCAQAACTQPGACCFTPDATGAGGCILLAPAACAAAGGTFQGPGTACASGTPCWSAPTLWNNGPIETHPLESQVQPGNTLFGANAYRVVLNIPGGFTIADDFVITSAGGWQIDEVTLFGQRNSTQATTFTKVCLEIWDGRPGDPGSAVIFGDTTTNRLIDSTPTGVFRFLAGAPTTTRQVFANRVAVNTTLPPGHYWLRWSAEVQASEATANQSPFVTLLGSRAPINANAIQSLGIPFHPLLDDVNLPLVPQDLPFIIRGVALGGACYANCDNSTQAPILNVADFGCFLTRYAAGDPYANCDQSTQPPILNVADFGCFLTKYAAGCP